MQRTQRNHQRPPDGRLNPNCSASSAPLRSLRRERSTAQRRIIRGVGLVRGQGPGSWSGRREVGCRDGRLAAGLRRLPVAPPIAKGIGAAVAGRTTQGVPDRGSRWTLTLRPLPALASNRVRLPAIPTADPTRRSAYRGERNRNVLACARPSPRELRSAPRAAPSHKNSPAPSPRAAGQAPSRRRSQESAPRLAAWRNVGARVCRPAY